jgi:excinuclease ABC subunit B
MARVIAETSRPALVIAHNKTLAAQLCNEFRELLPGAAVEYFVSYYDYYQPEAYLPRSDTYIEKDSSRNEEIDRLRHAATAALLARRDVVIVASVSCIYGLGSAQAYRDRVLVLAVGEEHPREKIFAHLVQSLYQRNDTVLERGRFRVRGDTLEVQPADSETAYRVSMWGDEVESITEFDPLTGEVLNDLKHMAIYPATHYITPPETIDRALKEIRAELEHQVAEFEIAGKLVEAHRLRQRTEYDMEMIRELGFCSGIENYSRILDGRMPGEPPHTLLDFFPDDFVCFIDESHNTMGQLRGMYEGDRSRKLALIDAGFRLPSALDNRPLQLPEFLERVNQVVFVSRTSTSGSITPVGRTICSTIREEWLRSKSLGVADTNTICGVCSRNSSKVWGRLSSALGSRKPKSTSVFLRERSPSNMPPICGTVWCDSSMKQTKSSGKKSSRQNGRSPGARPSRMRE